MPSLRRPRAGFSECIPRRCLGSTPLDARLQSARNRFASGIRNEGSLKCVLVNKLGRFCSNLILNPVLGVDEGGLEQRLSHLVWLRLALGLGDGDIKVPK